MTEEERQAHIERLRKSKVVELENVKLLHKWLSRKRNSRQCCRVVGESRTGKTFACKAYMRRHGRSSQSGKIPIVPIVYVQPHQECSSRELFRVILDFFNLKLKRGTVGDVRNRTLEALKYSQVEMLIIDEADRLKPKTFADVRDIFDKLEISVVLVGTKQRLNEAVKSDEQVYNRFRSCYEIGTLNKTELKQIVAIWERDILQLPVPSNLTSKPMLDIIEKATGQLITEDKTAVRWGYYIGLLDMLLREAAIRSLEKGLSKIDKAILQEVAEEFQ